MDYIQAGDEEGARAAVGRFFQAIAEGGIHHPIRVKTAVLNVLYIFMKVLKPYEEQLPSASADSCMKWTEMILGAETLDDIRRSVDELAAGFMQSLRSVKGQPARPQIMNIKRYVYEHIEQNISLEDAAEFSNMSRSYFSYIFKKEIGESFTHFVNRTKMEKARDLIMKRNLKVYEAAEKVGIPDEAYFSKLFKKYIGVSPGKIRGKGN
ncbi:AraC family transcriptional regulator [Paenibacillus sp. P25]|nr:AraC family transcriptional regulator [Paenibacillus sp. P25]